LTITHYSSSNYEFFLIIDKNSNIGLSINNYIKG